MLYSSIKKGRVRYALAASALAIATGIGPAAIAQSDTGQDAYVDEIIVTGSNIRTRRSDFTSPSPIQTVGEKEIADTGAIQIQDVFKGITANSGSQLLGDVTLTQGVSQFSLRGLGLGSTLTLINGRRAGLSPVTDGSGQLFTDSNQYPINFIEKVEVLTDGASTTYGSEAVAGVVNIFTRDDFDGLEIGAEFRDATNQSAQFNVALGSQGDRGGIAVFGNFYTQTSATRSDFPNFADGNLLEDGVSGGFDSITGSPGRFNLAIDNGDGTFTRDRLNGGVADPNCVEAGGLFDTQNDTTAVGTGNVTAGTAGLTTLDSGAEVFVAEGTNCRYHFLDQRRIFPEEDRVQLFATGNYDVSDNFNLFAEVGFNRNSIRDGNGGLLVRGFPDDGGFLVPADHPFNFFVADADNGITYAGPEAFAADPTLQAVDVIYRGRPLGSDADGENQEDIDTTFTNTRLVGGLDYQINDDWNFYSSFVWANGDFLRSAPREWDVGVFADLIRSGDWNPFGTRITDVDLISPKDGVSVAGNSEEVEAQFSLFRNDRALVRQSVAEGSLSGITPLELPGGPVSLAVGGQYRDVILEDVPDGRFQSGDNRLLETVPAVFGEQSVYAFFGEANLPILDNFEAQLALRFEDFGDQGGSTLDPKFAAKYDFNDALSFRGSYGTAFQAPSIRQLAGIITNGTVTDPGPAPGETLGLGSVGDNVIITIITEGSEDLVPQSATNLNLGVIYRPDWGLDFSVDWFRLDYESLILQDFSAQVIFDNVAAGTLEPDRVLRSGDGQASTAIANFINGGDAIASGFDIVAAYRTEGLGGDLTFDVKSTILTRFDSSEFGDILGSRNFQNGFGSLPDFRLNGGVTYGTGAHVVNLTGRYIGSYTDDQGGAEIDDNLTVDLRYDIKLDEVFDIGGGGTFLSLGAVNIFDTLAPRLENRPFFDTEVHDPRGRQLYVSIKQSF